MQENFPILKCVSHLKEEFKSLSTIRLNSVEFNIGRSLENSAVIAALAISRRHCVLKRTKNEQWCIEDLSSGGIRINNIKMKKGAAQILTSNDLIQLDITGDFIYKFIIDVDDYEPPLKKQKSEQDGVLENVKQKFEESQNIEIENHQSRLVNVQQMQNTSLLMKQQLEKEMEEVRAEMERTLNDKIEQLKGEQQEVEKQKEHLQLEHNERLKQLSEENSNRIKELQDKIDKHAEAESKLTEENNLLKERLVKEREQFLEQLNKESESKQGMLEQLEEKLASLEAERQKERAALEETLRQETEQLILAKDKELRELQERVEAERARREAELEKERIALQERVVTSAEERQRAEEQYLQALDTLNQAAVDEKINMEKMMNEKSEKYTEVINKLQEQLKQVQDNKQQYSENISTLQEELNKVRYELQSVEMEKKELLANLESGSGPSNATEMNELVKMNVLTEFGEIVETELQCSICSDLLIAATTLNCSHTYCKYCINEWKKKKKECPICRAVITSECRSLILDSFINKMVENLTDEMKQKRLQVLKDRAELESGSAKNTDALSSRRNSYGYDSDNSVEDESIEEEEYERGERWWWEGDDDSEGGFGFSDDESDYGASEDEYGSSAYSEFTANSDHRPSVADSAGAASSTATDSATTSTVGSGASTANSSFNTVNTEVDATVSTGTGAGRGQARRSNSSSRRGQVVAGIPGSFYGGYGRCFSCGSRGHWAPGCPFR